MKSHLTLFGICLSQWSSHNNPLGRYRNQDFETTAQFVPKVSPRIVTVLVEENFFVDSPHADNAPNYFLYSCTFFYDLPPLLLPPQLVHMQGLALETYG